MKITGSDSLPGYFNEQTREYVPWYVDLFDGGGLNAAGGVAQQEAAQSKAAAAGITPGGAPMAQPGLLANNQLSDRRGQIVVVLALTHAILVALKVMALWVKPALLALA